MKPMLLLLAALALPPLAGCAAAGDASAREWERAECNRIIDREDRERCLKRL